MSENLEVHKNQATVEYDYLIKFLALGYFYLFFFVVKIQNKNVI